MSDATIESQESREAKFAEILRESGGLDFPPHVHELVKHFFMCGWLCGSCWQMDFDKRHLREIDAKIDELVRGKS